MALITGLQARLQHGPPRKLIGASRILPSQDSESVQKGFNITETAAGNPDANTGGRIQHDNPLKLTYQQSLCGHLRSPIHHIGRRLVATES